MINLKIIVFKKRKAYISMNILSLFIFISLIFSSIFLIEKNTASFLKENAEAIKADYISEQALKVVQINFYKAIENSFYESSNEDEFFSLMSSVSGKEFYKAKDMIYYSLPNVEIEILGENQKSQISDDKRYMDFIMQIVYKDDNYIRNYIKKARVFNPYKKIQAKDKKIKDISCEDLKILFKYMK